MTGPGGPALRVTGTVLAGAAGGLLLNWTRLPAGSLVGAVLGSALAGSAVDARAHRLHGWMRTAGLVLFGCVAAARLDGDSIDALLGVLPAVLAAVVTLLALNMLLARWLVRRRGFDPITAVLSCVPGGFSELSAVAAREGADTATVAVIHLVRVLAVVLLVVPGLVVVLSRLP